MRADNETESLSAEVEDGEGPGRAAASGDLAAAVVIAIFSALVVVFSVRLDVPGSISTAPGLFPVIIGSTLFAMAAVLGWRAIRAGAILRWLPIRAETVLRWRERRETQAGAILGASGGLLRRWANACRVIGLATETAGETAPEPEAGKVTETGGETGGGEAAETGGGEAREGARTALLMAIVTAYVLLVGLINFEFSLPLGFFTVRISSYEVISVVMVAWILRLYWRAHPARCLIVALVSVEILASIFRYGFGIPMPAGY